MFLLLCSFVLSVVDGDGHDDDDDGDGGGYQIPLMTHSGPHGPTHNPIHDMCGCAGGSGEGDWADSEPADGQAPQGRHHTLSGQTVCSVDEEAMLNALTAPACCATASIATM